MRYPFTILWRSLVRPFYRENAGTFIFIFIMMFYIVGEDDGAGLMEYHYSLIMGMLTSKVMLLLIFFIWAVYARKYTAFASKVLGDPRYSFLHIYNCLEPRRRFLLFFFVEISLLMPVVLYSVLIVTTGCYHHLYGTVALIILFLILLCIIPAGWHTYRLSSPYRRLTVPRRSSGPSLFSSSYQLVLIRFIFRKQKMIWLGIKIFTCGLLYLIAGNNTLTSSDIRTVFLFYNFGIIGNGIIVYRVREFEETQLTFYRGAPVSLAKRFFQYSFAYFVLLIPEFVTAAGLAPLHLSYNDAIAFALCGYSLLLLMNAITFLQDFSMRDFLKIILLVFSIQYIFIVSGMLSFMYGLFFILSMVVFRVGYYKFERNI